MHQQNLNPEEMDQPRYDREMLRKVTELADRLQRHERDLLTAGEIEGIGQEVGLDPAFIRRALAELTKARTGAAPAVTASPSDLRAYSVAWWSAGWTIPMIMMMLGPRGNGQIGAILFFLGVGIYLAVGLVLGVRREMAQQAEAAHPKTEVVGSLRDLHREAGQQEAEQQVRQQGRSE